MKVLPFLENLRLSHHSQLLLLLMCSSEHRARVDETVLALAPCPLLQPAAGAGFRCADAGEEFQSP